MKPSVRQTALSLALLLTLALPAYAKASAGKPASAGTVMDGISPPLRKFGRGLANVATGVLEILYKVHAVYLDQWAVASVSVGVVSGVGAAITRTVAGVIETVTFLFPLGRYGYEPLVRPEFLLLPDHS